MLWARVAAQGQCRASTPHTRQTRTSGPSIENALSSWAHGLTQGQLLCLVIPTRARDRLCEQARARKGLCVNTGTPGKCEQARLRRCCQAQMAEKAQIASRHLRSQGGAGVQCRIALALWTPEVAEQGAHRPCSVLDLKGLRPACTTACLFLRVPLNLRWTES